MIEVSCTEMTLDDQLALASAISEGLEEKAVAIVRDDVIVVDVMAGRVEPREVLNVVRDFVSKRKEAQYYSVEADGEGIIIHSPDPLARSRGRKDTGQLLPDNLMKCSFCSFVTPFEELYTVHMRSHGFGL